MTERRARKSRRDHAVRFSVLFVPPTLAVLIVFSLVAGVLFVSATESDESVRNDQRHHLETGLRESIHIIAVGNLDWGWWDELQRNLFPVPKRDWLDNYIGNDLADAFGVSHTLVLMPDERLHYGIVAGGDPITDEFAESVSKRIRPLMAETQATPYDDPKPATGYVEIDGSLYLVSVMRLTPEAAPPISEQKTPRPLMVFLKLLDREEIARIGEAYLLKGLTFVTGPTPPHMASISIRGPTNNVIGSFFWHPEHPGADLFWRVIPYIIGAFGIVVVLLVIFWRRAHALIAVHEASLAALMAEKVRAEAASSAKSDFLASMSHELRTPLNAIIGFSQMIEMRDKAGMNVDIVDAANAIHRSGRHLLDLVEQVLDLARVDEGRIAVELKPVFVAATVSDAVTMVRPAATEKNVRIEIDDTLSGGAIVSADRLRLNQVLVNLLINAIKYNVPNGSVRISVRPVEPGRLRIAITDTGVGISSGDQARLFEPFVRLGSAPFMAGGAGIGLALSKSLIELMRGSIGFESTPDTGSTFWIDLEMAAGNDCN